MGECSPPSKMPGALIVCCVLVFACNKRGGDDDAIVEKYLSMWADMGRAIEASEGDCTKMVVGLEVVVAKYERDLATIRAYHLLRPTTST